MDKHEVNRLLFCMKERDELKAFRDESWYNLCPECEKYFYTNFLNWVWNEDESQYVPRKDSGVKK